MLQQNNICEANPLNFYYLDDVKFSQICCGAFSKFAAWFVVAVRLSSGSSLEKTAEVPRNLKGRGIASVRRKSKV